MTQPAMNPALRRILHFNLVGVLGCVLQLTALALLNRVLGGRYLLAAAIALELTLLNNFALHRRLTWRDRRDQTPILTQLVRFHLANGLVSLIGNLALLRLLVHRAHLPLLLANLLAILACALANFTLAHLWAFPSRTLSSGCPIHRGRFAMGGNRRSRPSSSIVAILILIATTAMNAQTPQPAPRDYGTDCAYENIFLGPSVAAGGAAAQPTFTGGVTGGMYFARPLGSRITAAPQFELGIVGPLPRGHVLDGLAGYDTMIAQKIPYRGLYPFLTAGYTRFFVTGNAANFGLGLDFGPQNSDRLTRIELRDYLIFTGPHQHILSLRIALGKLIPD
jgi:putative flippase GtrA